MVLSSPPRSAGLQAVDYFLWALQRCYERGEDSYIQYVWDKVGLVHDIADHRERRTGTYYDAKKPLLAENLADERKKNRPGDIGPLT